MTKADNIFISIVAVALKINVYLSILKGKLLTTPPPCPIPTPPHPPPQKKEKKKNYSKIS